jgi:hypothetical protein
MGDRVPPLTGSRPILASGAKPEELQAFADSLVPKERKSSEAMA